MAIDNFIPQVWAATMMKYLDKNLVAGDLVNRDYEGEISGFGDTVKINQIGPVTVSSYTKNTDISAAETLTGDQTQLVIDQAKYFNFQVDDIDKAQQNPKVMQTAMRRAAYGVRDTIDTALFVLMSANVPSGNILTADTSMASIDAYDHLVELSVLLDEANVPEEDRWATVPPWYHGLLLKDSRFVSATPQGVDILRSGHVGEAAGMSIYKSNNLVKPTGTTYDTLAGSRLATSFAMQVSEVEAYRPERRFGDAVKGLTVYGYKVVLPNSLVKIVCTKP